MRSAKEKAELCRALHAGAEPTLSAACWDVGTACLLAHVGVPLIDTTSFGAMATRGLPDAVGLATRDFMLGNARLIAASVDLPVQADLENGFGDSPEIVAQTILEAGTTGIVGGSIEDATGRPADPIYPLELAKERISAAAEVACALPFPFMLTARADQYLWGRPDLAEVIQRAQAFETAGANAIMVPGLSDLVALKSLCDRREPARGGAYRRGPWWTSPREIGCDRRKAHRRWRGHGSRGALGLCEHRPGSNRRARTRRLARRHVRPRDHRDLPAPPRQFLTVKLVTGRPYERRGEPKGGDQASHRELPTLYLQQRTSSAMRSISSRSDRPMSAYVYEPQALTGGVDTAAWCA